MIQEGGNLQRLVMPIMLLLIMFLCFPAHIDLLSTNIYENGRTMRIIYNQSILARAVGVAVGRR